MTLRATGTYIQDATGDKNDATWDRLLIAALPGVNISMLKVGDEIVVAGKVAETSEISRALTLLLATEYSYKTKGTSFRLQLFSAVMGTPLLRLGWALVSNSGDR